MATEAKAKSFLFTVSARPPCGGNPPGLRQLEGSSNDRCHEQPPNLCISKGFQPIHGAPQLTLPTTDCTSLLAAAAAAHLWEPPPHYYYQAAGTLPTPWRPASRLALLRGPVAWHNRSSGWANQGCWTKRLHQPWTTFALADKHTACPPPHCRPGASTPK